MEELPEDDDLCALEEMIISRQWSDAYPDDEDDDTIFLLPDYPPDFRPAA